MGEEEQRLLVKSCGDVFMFYIIDWNTRLSYFEVKCHDAVFIDPTVASADEAFLGMCEMEQKRGGR